MQKKQTRRPAAAPKRATGTAPRKKTRRAQKRRFYAVPCMITIVVVAVLMTGAGRFLRETLLKGLPQYNDAPDIAIPMMLMQDSGPLREARERVSWEKAQGGSSGMLTMAAAQPEAEIAAPVMPAEEAAEAEPAPEAPEAEAPAAVAAPVEEVATGAEVPAVESPEETAPEVGEQGEEAPAADPAAEAAVPDADVQAEENPAGEAVPDEALADADAEAEAAGEGDAPLAEETLLAAETPVEIDEAELPDWLLEEPQEITEAYFDHTLFIGDSKTDGMRMWARLGKAHYFCGTSYSVFNIFDKKSSDKDFTDQKLDKVLSTFKYDQIYIILGYNESGYPFENLMKQFKYVINRVHEAQPQARIILHGVMHASERVSKKHDYSSVANLEKINAALRDFAQSYDGLYFVDCNEAFCDENGYLFSYATSDGEHLSPDYTRQWAQEILKRAVVE